MIYKTYTHNYRLSNPNPLKTGGELRCPEGQAVPVNLVSIPGISLVSVRQV
jgi:hypothetical protein